MRTAVTIAGSDSGGGAGIQADLKTFAAHGVFGMSVITAVTAQNTLTVTASLALEPELVAAQIDAVASDLPIHAVKVGMLATTGIVGAVAEALARHHLAPVVLDPVMVAKGGARLLVDDATEALRARLLPLATIVTPNAPEAAVLTGLPVTNLAEQRAAAVELVRLGAAAALVKGGHLDGTAVDVLPMRTRSSSCGANAFPAGTRTAPGARCRPPSRRGWPSATVFATPSQKPRPT
jgi:hydroxymethylpyrimidine/phosphomethylpyrimidine kinase